MNLILKRTGAGVVVHAFNPSTGGRGRQISEFEASLVYKVSSRTARAIERIPVSKKKKGRVSPRDWDAYTLHDHLANVSLKITAESRHLQNQNHKSTGLVLRKFRNEDHETGAGHEDQSKLPPRHSSCVEQIPKTEMP
jgi:hypothetical protein